VLVERRETTGAPAKAVFRPDRLQIAADGEDLASVAVEIVDARGHLVPAAGNEITFRVEGPARLIGLGNGDPSCHEADKPASFTEGRRSAFNGLCMVMVQALKQPGTIHVQANSVGLASASIAIAANPVKWRPAI
jgi:beta-galactosidase